MAIQYQVIQATAEQVSTIQNFQSWLTTMGASGWDLIKIYPNRTFVFGIGLNTSSSISSTSHDVTGGYELTSSDAGKTIYLSGDAANITLSNFSAANFANFINTTGNTYTFIAGSGSILSDSGKNKSVTQYTAVSAIFDGLNWNLIGKLSA